MKAEIKLVTPQWAAEKMAAHDKAIAEGRFAQRSVTRQVVEKYASDMRAGNWGLNGQGISFDTEGNLLDGQHRLYAVIKAGVDVKMLILWDVPAAVNDRVKTIDTFDIGKNRTIGGQLRIEGFPYYNELGSTARMLAIASTGLENSNTKMTIPQGIQIVSLFRGTMEGLIHKLVAGDQKKNARAFILAPLTLLRSNMPEEADLFAQDYNEMANLPKGSPVLAFRRYIERPVLMGGTQFGIRGFFGMATALEYYVKEKKVDTFRGAQSSVDWLLKLSRSQIDLIRKVMGAVETVESLRQQP